MAPMARTRARADINHGHRLPVQLAPARSHRGAFLRVAHRRTLRRFGACNRMKRVLRCHDFGSGQGAGRREYREYSQGARRCPGPKLVPALRVTAKIGGVPERGAGAPLAGMRPRRHVKGSRVMARYCLAPGSHPSAQRLEPAPPCARHFVGRLGHIRDMTCIALRVIADFRA